MNDPTGNPTPSSERLPSTVQEGGKSESRASRVITEKDPIKHRLGIVLSRIDEAIAACIRHEALGNQVETTTPWQFVPRHLTEIDSLRRLRHHLDRLSARLQPAIASHRIPDPSDPLYKFDKALTECAETMIRRFDEADVQHDFQADLASDLCKFEFLLDERTML